MQNCLCEVSKTIFLTYSYLSIFFITQITNTQMHHDKPSTWEFTTNALCSEAFIHLTKASHRIFSFNSYHIKLSFYLNCVCA